MAGLFSFLLCLWGILLLPGLALLIAGRAAQKPRMKRAGWIICVAMFSLAWASYTCAIFLIE